MILCPRNIASDLMKVSGTGSITRSDLEPTKINMSEFIAALPSPGSKVFNLVIGVPNYAQMDQAKVKESPVVFQQYD